MSIEEKNWQTAWQNRGLVYGAIKQAGVNRQDPDYEDLIQAGIMQYAKILANDHKITNGWIFQKVKWSSIDFLRRRNKTWEDLSCDSSKLRSSDYLTIEALLPQLSALELIILRRHLLGPENLSDLAAATGRSYRTIKRTKANLCRRLRSSLTS
ncbi:MAG: hypothetical protein LKG31_03310 [Lactobacillus sp.]|jgi:hypothetical protein|nr:hypothetical protein [Lactobacillus sp.]